jgi:hypothetical protein
VLWAVASIVWILLLGVLFLTSAGRPRLVVIALLFAALGAACIAAIATGDHYVVLISVAMAFATRHFLRASETDVD